MFGRGRGDDDDLADVYGVQIEPGTDDILLLAATVVVDQLTHDVK